MSLKIQETSKHLKEKKYENQNLSLVREKLLKKYNFSYQNKSININWHK